MTDKPSPPAPRIVAAHLLIDKGARRYDPDRHLDRLLGGGGGIWRQAGDPAATIARLKRALRSQRRLGRAGHWSYDLNRHFGLLQALKAELARSRAHTATGAGGNAAATPMAAGIPETATSETGTATSWPRIMPAPGPSVASGSRSQN